MSLSSRAQTKRKRYSDENEFDSSLAFEFSSTNSGSIQSNSIDTSTKEDNSLQTQLTPLSNFHESLKVSFFFLFFFFIFFCF